MPERTVFIALLVSLFCALGCDGGERSASSKVAEAGFNTTGGTPSPKRGMYVYMADAAIFQDCVTGLRLPVAMELDSLALERAYLEARPEPGAAMLVTFDGRISKRQRMEGEGTEEVMLVEHFDRVWPGADCKGEMAQGAAEDEAAATAPGESVVASEFEDRVWVLTELGGVPLELEAGQERPQFQMVSSQRDAIGFAGCNRFFGGYTTEGTSLAFSPLSTTRMACAVGMELEQGFLQALGATTAFEIVEGALVLRGEAGVLARFEVQASP